MNSEHPCPICGLPSVAIRYHGKPTRYLCTSALAHEWEYDFQAVEAEPPASDLPVELL